MGWTRSKYFIAYTNICRLVLSLVLVMSGFVKAVDPIGAMYKMGEYMTAFSIDLFSDSWLLVFGISQAVVEFLLGLFLLMGVYRRVVSYLTPIVMLFFTVLTAIIYFSGNIEDCGCFGEAIALSNGETLAKNIFLLFLSLPLLSGRKRFVCHISFRTRWMVVIFAIFYIATVGIMSYSHLPVVDFSRYRVGTDLRALTQGEPGEYRVISVYEREGETCELPEGEEPDTTWTFVGNRSEIIKESIEPVIADFSIMDWEYDCDVAEELLADTGYVCLVAMERVENASVSRVDKINDMYDYCQEIGVPFYVATASEDEDIALWCKRTGAEYPLYWGDELMLRGMVRSNPGVLLFKDGVIVGKWNISDLPPVEEMAESPTGMPDGLPTLLQWMQGWRFWLLALALPLLLFVLIDVMACRGSRSKDEGTDVGSDAGSTGAPQTEGID